MSNTNSTIPSNSGNKTIAVAGRLIGPGHDCFVIAEVAQAHDGSLGTAHAYIDAIAKTSADAVKFQTHIADAESTAGEPFRVKFSPQDSTRFDYWKRMEFTESQWCGLAKHAREAGLIFLSTPFSFEAVDLLERLGVAAWKIGSGEVNNLPLLERVAQTNRPVILSSGMSSWSELDAAVETLHASNSPFAMMQCTTAYPCPPERVGLNVVTKIRQRYGCPAGLSDHTGTIYSSLASVALGANLLEVHTVLSRKCFGPDVSASVTTDELTQLVAGTRCIEQAIRTEINKDEVAIEMGELRRIFGKSLVSKRDLRAGDCLTNEDVAFKKPGTGIVASRLQEMIGRKLSTYVPANTLLMDSHFEQ